LNNGNLKEHEKMSLLVNPEFHISNLKGFRFELLLGIFSGFEYWKKKAINVYFLSRSRTVTVNLPFSGAKLKMLLKLIGQKLIITFTFRNQDIMGTNFNVIDQSKQFLETVSSISHSNILRTNSVMLQASQSSQFVI